MRVVFMGTPSFAATILEELIPQHEVVAVYTRPDAVRGRGKALVASPVKEVALAASIPVHTPRTLRDEDEQRLLAAYEPDIICVAAYGMILPAAVLDTPRFGCVNVHASLLPRWRGAAPIERAILAGDKQAGVCIMRMEEGLDTGAWCVSRATDIAEKNAVELTDELGNLGARALLTALEHIAAEQVSWTSQDEALVTYADKLAKGELNLNPDSSALDNMRQVRASSEAHPARCVIAGRPVTVLSARLVAEGDPALSVLAELSPGRAVFCAKRLLITCAEGALEVSCLKPDGKKPMEAKAFAAGLPALKQGVEWEALDA